ncbi:MAG: hypothetical protein WD358_06410 [Nitriliruptoraceae bacterium]
MYRDDPLDDELELRAIVGDEAIDQMLAETGANATACMEAALDVLRILQGWTDDDGVKAWFLRPQRRLGGRTPLSALAAGDVEDVDDAAALWVAARA